MRKVFLIITIVVSCSLGACNSSTAKEKSKTTDKNKQAIVDEKYLEWPKYLRTAYCDIYKGNVLPRDLAIIDQVEDYYRMTGDNSTTTDMYCESLSRLVDTLRNEIEYNHYVVFSALMRATALNVFYNKNTFNLEKGKIPTKCDRYSDGMLLPFRWNTSLRDDSLGMEIMSTICFRSSYEALNLFASLNIYFRESDESQLSVLTVTDYIDKTIDSLQLYFTDSNNSVIASYNSDNVDVYIDSTDYKTDGVIRMILPTEYILYALNYSSTMVVEYVGKNGRVELTSFAPIPFKEQIKDCQRLNNLMNTLLKK